MQFQHRSRDVAREQKGSFADFVRFLRACGWLLTHVEARAMPDRLPVIAIGFLFWGLGFGIWVLGFARPDLDSRA